MKKEKGKRKFHWYYVPLAIVGVVLVLVIVLVCFLHSMLPWKNMLAATSNLQITLSEKQKEYVRGGERDYSTLPDALTTEDGAKITTTAQFDERRDEVLDLFKEYVYGTFPEKGYQTSFETVEEGDALDGKAIRKQIKITVTTDKGTSDALMLLYIPKTENPAPVVLGLNSNGNHAAIADDAVLPSYSFDTEDGTWEEKRGEKEYRWNIKDSIDKGYAVATIYAEDFAPDDKDTYNSRVISLFDEKEFKAVGAWAFGLMRGVDYLVQDEAIDSEHIAVVGHSRLGKAAVWAGANDERIGMVISNDSGNTGASLSRENRGETVKSITTAFPHWFCSKYASYGKKEETLPVDQNLLLAAIAPRIIYVASADDDLWSDPTGAWNSLNAAKEAYALYGLEVLPDSAKDTPIGTGAWCESMGYHVRAGWHDMTEEDWRLYLAYMDQYFLTR